jgi:hypothetical protein
MEWLLHGNLAWITCIDVLWDVLLTQTTVGLATSRRVPFGGTEHVCGSDPRGLADSMSEVQCGSTCNSLAQHVLCPNRGLSRASWPLGRKIYIHTYIARI